MIEEYKINDLALLFFFGFWIAVLVYRTGRLEKRIHLFEEARQRFDEATDELELSLHKFKEARDRLGTMADKVEEYVNREKTREQLTTINPVLSKMEKT